LAETKEKLQDGRIIEIPISQIDDFEEHPFKVKMDEDMEQLVESILQNGVITPATVRRKEEGRYELISGHRRKQACIIAGITTLKSEVRELTRNEAIVLMVESNLQRSEVLPSEKAFAYKMRLEAMKRQEMIFYAQQKRKISSQKGEQIKYDKKKIAQRDTGK